MRTFETYYPAHRVASGIKQSSIAPMAPTAGANAGSRVASRRGFADDLRASTVGANAGHRVASRHGFADDPMGSMAEGANAGVSGGAGLHGFSSTVNSMPPTCFASRL
jgi:hypothetical protein